MARPPNSKKPSGNCHLPACCHWLNPNMYRLQSAVCNFLNLPISRPWKDAEKSGWATHSPALVPMYMYTEYVCSGVQTGVST